MFGLMILGGLTLYILISLFIVRMIHKKTGSLVKKRIALVVLLLIPTWDIIIGYPIFWYLCKFKSGMKIYKPVENVEGFYVGEKHGKYEPIDPREGFKYVDYRDDRDGKYYRSYWLDNTNSELCVKPKLNGKSYFQRNYKKEFANGKCLVKQPLKLDQVSRFEVKYDTGWRKHNTLIPLLKFYKIKRIAIRDRKTNETLSAFITYTWNTGWLKNSLSMTGGKNIECKYKGDQFKDTFNLTLKPYNGDN